MSTPADPNENKNPTATSAPTSPSASTATQDPKPAEPAKPEEPNKDDASENTVTPVAPADPEKKETEEDKKLRKQAEKQVDEEVSAKEWKEFAEKVKGLAGDASKEADRKSDPFEKLALLLQALIFAVVSKIADGPDPKDDAAKEANQKAREDRIQKIMAEMEGEKDPNKAVSDQLAEIEKTQGNNPRLQTAKALQKDINGLEDASKKDSGAALEDARKAQDGISKLKSKKDPAAALGGVTQALSTPNTSPTPPPSAGNTGPTSGGLPQGKGKNPNPKGNTPGQDNATPAATKPTM